MVLSGGSVHQVCHCGIVRWQCLPDVSLGIVGWQCLPGVSLWYCLVAVFVSCVTVVLSGGSVRHVCHCCIVGWQCSIGMAQ